MRRFLRILLNGLTAGSLVLCAAAIALSVRSYFVADQFAIDREDNWHVFAQSSRGILRVNARQSLRGHPEGTPLFSRVAPYDLGARADNRNEPGVRSYFDVGRVGWFRTDGGPFVVPDSPSARRAGLAGTTITFAPRWEAVAPHWVLAVFLAALPTTRLLLRLRRGPRRPGDCASCGYDLTGNTSGICPECGGIRDGSGV